MAESDLGKIENHASTASMPDLLAHARNLAYSKDAMELGIAVNPMRDVDAEINTAASIYDKNVMPPSVIAKEAAIGTATGLGAGALTGVTVDSIDTLGKMVGSAAAPVIRALPFRGIENFAIESTAFEGVATKALSLRGAALGFAVGAAWAAGNYEIKKHAKTGSWF